MAGITEYNQNFLNKSQEYIAQAHDYVDETGKMRVRLPKVEGLAVYLGVARSTVYKWANENPEFSDILERINALQADRVIDRATEGTYNSTIAKLLLTKHGYRDASELMGKDGNDLKINLINYGDTNNSLPVQTAPVSDSTPPSTSTV